MKKAKSGSQRAREKRLERGELILIRTGQHIFRLWRLSGRGDASLESAMEQVWAIKAELRAEKRAMRRIPSQNYRKPSRLSGK